MNILVVDDDPSIMVCLVKALRLEGIHTASCSSAVEARALLPYVDAVITDGLGYECFAVVADAEARGIPVVIFTGSDTIAAAARCASVPVVLKPACVSELLAALELQEVPG